MGHSTFGIPLTSDRVGRVVHRPARSGEITPKAVGRTIDDLDGYNLQ
jgi:hypothetical protein